MASAIGAGVGDAGPVGAVDPSTEAGGGAVGEPDRLRAVGEVAVGAVDGAGERVDRGDPGGESCVPW
jgi:hypothetical protein